MTFLAPRSLSDTANRPRHRWVALLLSASLLIGGSQAVGSPAQAESLTGTISGTVTDSVTGDPLVGVSISFQPVAESETFGYASTDEQGNYVSEPLLGGSYTVFFSTGGSQVDMYFGGSTQFDLAQLVDVTADGSATGIDAALDPAAQISGTVTSADSGLPLEGVFVSLFDANSQSFGYGSTDASGEYVIRGLAGGSYDVTFDGSGAGHVTVTRPSPVAVSAGATVSGIDQALDLAGAIGGTVTDESTGLPVANAYVSVAPVSDPFATSRAAFSDETGAYRVDGLSAGVYTVQFSTFEGGFITEWWNGATTVESAQSVEVIAGETRASIDASLQPGGSISGVVTAGDSAAGLAGVSVTVHPFGDPWTVVGSSQTDDAGEYEVGGLPTGDYTVEFSVFDSPYVGEWFDNAATSQTASRVSVTAGSTVTAVDAALSIGGTISGTITDAETGAPVEGATVNAYANGGGGFGSATSGSDGTYRIQGLQTGSYSVSVSEAPENYVQAYRDAWVSVAVGQDSPEIDFALQRGGSITGAVRGPDGTALSGVQVCASSVVGFSYVCEPSNDEGVYRLAGVPAGQHTVQFESYGSGLATEWWNDASSRESATPVTVDVDSTVSGIDAQLAVGGTITGTVRGGTASGPLLGDVQVCASKDDVSKCANTSADGSYVIDGLAGGAYTVYFAPQYDGPLFGEYVAEYWNNAATFADADPISVVLGEESTGVSAILEAAASVSGTVTMTTGGSAEGVQVYLARDGKFGGFDYFGATTTSTGEFRVDGVRPGTYKVLFLGTDAAPEAKSEWWNDASSAASAAALTLAAGQDRVGVDAQLAPRGTPVRANAPIVSQLSREPGATWTVPTSTEPILAYVGGFNSGGAGDGGYLFSTSEPREFALDVDPSWIFDVRALTASGPGLAGYGVITGSNGAEALAGPALSVSEVSSTSATLSFSVPTSTAPPIQEWTVSGYTGAAGFVFYDRVTETVANGGSLDLSGLEPSTTYSFFVEGVSGAGETRFSRIDFTTPAGPVTAGSPTISGTVAVGSTVTAVPGTWAPAPVTLSYQWLRNGSTISGATGATYSPTAADLGTELSVRVTGTKSGYSPASATSPSSVVAAGTLTAGNPTVSGTPRVGAVLTASPGTWGPSPVSLSYQWLRGGSPIGAATSATYTATSADIGASLSVRVTGTKSGYTSRSQTSAGTADVVEVTRLSSDTRYTTAAEIAKQFAPGVPVVYIATGQKYPDALGAAAAAAHLGGALLLVEPTSIPESTKQQLARLKPESIVVVGGPMSVSTSVEDELSAYAGDGGVRRDAGADRFDTSRIIAERAFGGTGATAAYIATGLNFPDALSASAAAGAAGSPVVLVYGPGSTLDEPTLDLFQRLGVESVTIAGGPASVSNGIQQSLVTRYGTDKVVRRTGADRFAAGLEINRGAFQTASTVYFATGLNFPDALAGGALAGSTPGPLYVLPSTCVPPAILSEIARLGATSVVLFGGPASLTDGVAKLTPCS